MSDSQKTEYLIMADFNGYIKTFHKRNIIMVFWIIACQIKKGVFQMLIRKQKI